MGKFFLDSKWFVDLTKSQPQVHDKGPAGEH
jgi:hypothetical protein